MCESFPEKLATLPEQLFLACMQLLERGVADYGVEVCTLSLESIEGVASSQARAESQSLGVWPPNQARAESQSLGVWPPARSLCSHHRHSHKYWNTS